MRVTCLWEVTSCSLSPTIAVFGHATWRQEMLLPPVSRPRALKWDTIHVDITNPTDDDTFVSPDTNERRIDGPDVPIAVANQQ